MEEKTARLAAATFFSLQQQNAIHKFKETRKKEKSFWLSAMLFLFIATATAEKIYFGHMVIDISKAFHFANRVRHSSAHNTLSGDDTANA